MTDDFGPIQPKQVPLTSRSDQPGSAPARSVSTTRLLVVLLTGLSIVLLAAVFWWLPQRIAPVSVNPADRPAPATPGAGAPTAAPQPEDAGPPPFEALQRQQARKKAQDELAAFVELQLELEERMTVGAWGQADYDEAKALATRGDEEFVAERFADSLASYGAATAALEALIERGEQIRQKALADGAKALDERDQAAAVEAFELARTIAPEDPTAAEGLRRAALLPEVDRLLRRAKNQELAGNWQAAQDTYAEIRELDPDTAGLDELLAAAAAGARDQQANERLSEGFAALEAGNYARAREAFRKVLSLRPGDDVARGGLAQVDDRAELGRIERLRRSAESAEDSGDWASAESAYRAVLDIDTTLRFARDGLRRAEQQRRTAGTLDRIIGAPNRLSSPELFADAQRILEEARSLEPRGPALQERIERVAELIQLYAVPVEVTFRSDNQTEVMLSTVGPLGTFAEKQLQLRPGAYTVTGSRDGCRDVREEIVVQPGMAPVVVRCTDTF